MVPELVDEDVFRERAVHRRGRHVVEDPAAAVRALVHQDLDELVRGRRGGVAQRAVVERQHVALRVEDVVLGRQRRATKDAGVRPVDAAFGRGDVERPHVEVAAAALVRLLGEQRLDQPLDVGVELRQLAGGVAVRHHEQIDLVARRAVLEDRPHGTGMAAERRAVHEARGRIDRGRPEGSEPVVGLPLLQHDGHRLAGPGEPQRFVERAVRRLHLGRGLPLAVDRPEPA